ncbi:hypothetical protein C2E25_06215 [Geothermobacter hydrogeniphilus]|uniref:Beta-ketoacyl synthase-like N-terminal domain-containing protein n=1 Tax=Geothermobacter hydrogeniphilus TaxID=1969733 RepID=A0A2K2HBE4_9BACT|nr:beta-ketoacyl synthase N-terminal-like domain-containing protein [Geothermobacter hydrogeniphilus]PNU20636.1 hypothetical protein C2E25_06215 [Geothermobacter hydrogeniphilus]
MSARVRGFGWVSATGAGRGRDGQLSLPEGTALLPPGRRVAFSKPYLRYGRLDDFSKLGLSTIALALQDAGVAEFDQKRPVGLYAASRYGCSVTDRAYFQTLLDDGGSLASPNLFAYTLANCFLGEAAIRFGLSGPAQVLNEAGSRSLAALRWALADLASGSCPMALAGYCDLPPEEPQQGFSLFLLLAPSGDGPLLEMHDDGPALAGRRLTSWLALLELLPQLKDS